jgi:uncharacterized protein (DUF952 family)
MQAIKKLIEKKDWKALEKHCLTQGFQSLGYVEKNKYFITASKLKQFERCPLTYKLKYIDALPDPTEKEPDYFVIGRALDDLVTYGDTYFKKNYEVVARRTKESKKTQLTGKMGKLVAQMNHEFRSQELFTQNPKKKVFFHEVGGFILKAELDDYEKGFIRDVKTCANIMTFDPEHYVLQMSMYQWLVEESTGELCQCEIEAVDKYDHFSRSKKVIYTNETLQAKRGELLVLLEKLKNSHETNIFMRSDRAGVVYNSPYYGHPEYGRWSEVEYY